MTSFNIGKFLIATGALIIVGGVVVMLGQRMGLGQLPGDISLRRGNGSFHFPIMTSIIVSVVLTVLINLALRFFR